MDKNSIFYGFLLLVTRSNQTKNEVNEPECVEISKHAPQQEADGRCGTCSTGGQGSSASAGVGRLPLTRRFRRSHLCSGSRLPTAPFSLPLSEGVDSDHLGPRSHRSRQPSLSNITCSAQEGGETSGGRCSWAILLGTHNMQSEASFSCPEFGRQIRDSSRRMQLHWGGRHCMGVTESNGQLYQPSGWDVFNFTRPEWSLLYTPREDQTQGQLNQDTCWTNPVARCVHPQWWTFLFRPGMFRPICRVPPGISVPEVA